MTTLRGPYTDLTLSAIILHMEQQLARSSAGLITLTDGQTHTLLNALRWVPGERGYIAEGGYTGRTERRKPPVEEGKK